MPWVMMDSANNASDNGFLLIQFLESITVAQLDLLRIDLPSRIKIVLFSDTRIQNCRYIVAGIKDYLNNSYGSYNCKSQKLTPE